MALHPVRHAHELVFSGFVRFVRFFVLLRADDERHMVIALAAAMRKAPLIHIAADRLGILIKRALFVGVQLRKLKSVRNVRSSIDMRDTSVPPCRSELDQLVGCRCAPAVDSPRLHLRRWFVPRLGLFKAAVFDGVVRNAARIGRQNRSWQQTQCHCQHHQSADGPLFPISFDVHDRSSLLLWGVKKVSNPLFLLMHKLDYSIVQTVIQWALFNETLQK